ncbi:MAG TPA: tRNA (adenosine(37)-N6)-threonylcarbamoyltransferase complex dimerization subunit type 1 TsaB [Thermodesulfovibrionales bacterium]|nr:tRNA (adenosine(37)-N6)-threonylcarbamoyltransferase complex dimerization subunit type 1 TsaB [Thermodesulfovibrionales bacterium]
MRTLGVETSTMLGGIAIMDDEKGLIAEIRLNIKTTHSERLMTGINLVLRQAGMKIADIDAFGIATGPGSFTGLRIGLSTVKGFSYATGKPVISIPTLEAFAWNFPYTKHPVCVMLDARKGEVYAAVFLWKDRDFERVMEARSIKVDELADILKGPVVFAGEGAVIYRESLEGLAHAQPIFAPPQWSVPSPSNIAYLAMKKAQKREFSDPLGLTPLYVRKSEAEVKLQGGS